jgi:Ca-activated chloride channel family protein
VFLSVLGVGTGNLKDATLEQIADNGNGHYAYLDGLQEARRVLVQQMRSTLVTVAKDVKVQVEFNPAQVRSYRLVGYENRALAARDFNDDKKDAGEMGAGHTVTAFYEVVPMGLRGAPQVDELRYGRPQVRDERAGSGADGASAELLAVKVRYKLPDGNESTKLEVPVTDGGAGYAQASADFKFASAVATFGMLLRGSPSAGNATFDSVLELATEGIGEDRDGRRTEFVDLVRKAKALTGR